MNYDFVKHCTGKEISDWLKYFSEIVDNKTLNTKNYKRIEYSVWREIKKLSEAKEVVVFGKTNSDTKKYKIYFSSPLTEEIILTEENDFARFLIEHGIIPEGGKTTENINSLNPPHLDTPYLDMIKTLTYDSNNNLTWTTNPYTSYATNTYVDTVADGFDELKSEVSKLQTTVKDFEKTIKKETNNEMTAVTSNNVFNFDFGPLNGTGIRMSMYGFAIPNEAGKYVAYDADNDRIMDVQILNFNCDGIFYKVPKALNKVAEGDVVFHNGTPVFVEDTDDNRLIVIDPKDGTEKTIMPARSPFGFDYVSTLVNLMDGFCKDVDPDEDNPFGKMLPFLFMGNTNNSNDLLPLMFMANGEMDFSNPLMLLAMGGGKNFDTSNPLVLMALMKSFNK